MPIIPAGITAAEVGTAVGLAGTAISAGTAIAGAVGSSDGATAANGVQTAAVAQNRADLLPYMAGGQGASTQQQNLLGLNGQPAADAAMSTFQASPGFAYQKQQGLRAVDQGAAASGMLRSGQTLQAELTLGDNLANQDFSNYYNRLAGLSGLGENAAAGVGNNGVQTAAGIAQTDTSAAAQQASILSGAGKSITSQLGNGANNLLYANGTGSTSPSGTFDGSTLMGNAGGSADWSGAVAA